MKNFLITLVLFAASLGFAQTTANLHLNTPADGTTDWGTLLNANMTILDGKLACLATTPLAGTMLYYSGSSWLCFTGNASGLKVLQEDSSGVLSWVVNGSGTVSSGTVSNIPKYISSTVVGDSAFSDDGSGNGNYPGTLSALVFKGSSSSTDAGLTLPNNIDGNLSLSDGSNGRFVYRNGYWWTSVSGNAFQLVAVHGGVRDISGDYTIAPGDEGRTLHFLTNGATATFLTMDATLFPNGWEVTLKTEGNTDLAISSPSLIDGASSIGLARYESVTIRSTGITWRTYDRGVNGINGYYVYANCTAALAQPKGCALVAGNIPNLDTAKITTGTWVAARFGTGVITDSMVALSEKPSVTVVAVANLTLSGNQTIDSTATVNAQSIVLATAQTTGSQNGPWIVQSSAWTRPTWYSAASTTQAIAFNTAFVRLGTLYGGSTWRMTTTAAVTIDSTATVWAQTPMVLSATSVAGLLPVANGGTALASGTSGGILGYTASGTLASSVALTIHGVVIGGGAGATPVSTAAGTSGQSLTSNGAADPTYQNRTTGQYCGTTTTCSATASNGFQEVWGHATLSTGAATVTGISPVFSATATTECFTNDRTDVTKTSNGILASTSSITLAGTGSDVIGFHCVGAY